MSDHQINRILKMLSLLFVIFFIYDYVTTDPILHFEGWYILPFYAKSAGKGFWGEFTKIFDICNTDACFERFRPLAHLLELIDAKVVVLLNPQFNYFFRSAWVPVLTFLIFFTLAKFLSALIGKKYQAWAWFFAASFILTVPMLLLSMTYFRPAKLLTAWVVLVMFWSWLNYRKIGLLETIKPLRKLAGYLGLIFFFSFMTFGDEQIVLIFAIFFGLALFEWIRFRKGSASVLLFLIPPIFYYIIWKEFAPWTYVTFKTGDLTPYSDPKSFWYFNERALLGGLHALFFILETLFGNKPEVSVITVITALSVLFYIGLKKGSKPEIMPKNRGPRQIGWMMTYFFAGVVGFLYVLDTRHKYLFSNDVKRNGYYFLPSFIMVYVIFMIFFYVKGALTDSRKRVILLYFWTAMTLMSFFSVELTRGVVFGNHMIGARDASRRMIRGFREKRFTADDVYKLGPHAGKFLTFWTENVDPSIRVEKN